MEFFGEKNNNSQAIVLADALDKATEQFLENDKSPSRKVGELDNRGSHFYLALYWAKALAEQNKDQELKAVFTPIAEKLSKSKDEILKQLNNAQGSPVNIGGYYLPDPNLISKAMRPSNTFNSILESI